MKKILSLLVVFISISLFSSGAIVSKGTASTSQSTVKAFKVTYNDTVYIKLIIDLKGDDFIIVADKYYISKTLGDKVYYYNEVVKDGKIEYKLYSNNTAKSEVIDIIE